MTISRLARPQEMRVPAIAPLALRLGPERGIKTLTNMFSVCRENKVRRMLYAGLVGGVASTFFFYCLLTGDDDVLRGRGSRATRAARADYDHDPHHHHDGCFTLPSAAVTHDGLEASIHSATSGQTTPLPAAALVAEGIAVPVPQLSSDPILTVADRAASSRTLLSYRGRGPPLA